MIKVKTNMPVKKKSIKIAMIAPFSPPYGGMSNQAMLLCKFLNQSGIEICFVPTNNSTLFLEKVFGRLPGIRTVIREGVFLSLLIRASKFCDIFHIMACSHLYFFLIVTPAILIGFLMGRRVIVNYRGGEAETFFKKKGRPAFRMLQVADTVIVPSRYLEDIFKKMGLKTTKIPNIVETNRFEYRLPEIRPQEEITFICTRQFELYYDVETVVRAFSIVKKSLPHAQLILVGEGSLQAVLIALVKNLNLDDSVFFRGKVNPEQIPLVLKASDIYVNASVVDNYPNSILEAFAAGLPVVTTCAGGIPFLVENNKNGILVGLRDYTSMAKAMIQLAKDQDLSRRLSRAGKRVADSHSWDGIWPLLKKEYKIGVL